ncbi:hypothetical protein AN640_04905 [Candidatus Epulonipiscium fishelsonii]|uniref:Uncharacterized protein n=1 Tax=Candidatus Epulonipiscium fishelsonii TaxID=77094 RepID=A0ACC8XIQ1_9FIRM|nr:hypothetical protein AN640_04905 [Epulopiscium sp. SCG-D08WGA-EpuloA1]
MDLSLIMRIAGLGLGLWAIEELLSKAGMGDAAKYVKIIGTLVILTFIINEILEFFETVQTFFTF